MKAAGGFATVLLALLIAGCGGSADRAVEDADADPYAAHPLDAITTRLGIQMVRVPAGRFVMGDDHGPADERPAHPVRLGAFYMDVGELTQGAFQQLMGRNPSKFRDPDRPVERVSWYSAAMCCNMRSRLEGLRPCYDPQTLACDFQADGYRLPTEAEWEYACRSGGTARWSCGNDPRQLGKHAWFKGNAAGKTHPVMQKRPNRWGLHDLHGNVAEWCHDFTSDGYPQQDEAQDPRGASHGDQRILRGGSWATGPESCRVSARDGETPRFADACFGTETYGFRCVRRVVEPSSGDQ